MRRVLLVGLWSLALAAGCAVIRDSVAPRVAQAVQLYCTEPLEVRRALRAQVADMVTPHAIRVDCAGDPAD